MRANWAPCHTRRAVEEAVQQRAGDITPVSEGTRCEPRLGGEWSVPAGQEGKRGREMHNHLGAPRESTGSAGRGEKELDSGWRSSRGQSRGVCTPRWGVVTSPP